MSGRLAGIIFMVATLTSAMGATGEARFASHGNPNANRKGTVQVTMSSEPETLNPFRSTDAYGSSIHGYTFSKLLTVDPETFDFVPELAESWEVSKDGLVFTFKLREGAIFDDGKPVRVEDVKFTFDSMRNPEYGAAHMIPYFENISEVAVLDPRTLRVTTKETYFKNLEMIGGIEVLPEHVYKDPKKRMNKEIVGSGPYRIESYDKGRRIVLVRNDGWFGFKVPHLKDRYNFERIAVRFVKQEDVGLELMKKGEVDYLSSITNEAFTKKMEGRGWEKVKKVKVENSTGKGYGFFGPNLQRPLFQDVRVRRALAHSLNRPFMNEKFRFNMSDLQAGPIYGRSPYASPKIKPIGFDLEEAKRLLKAAGWDDSDKSGLLDKIIDGKKVEFRFSLMNPNPDFEKYLTVYKEDLRKIGVELNIQQVEWNSLMKAVDEKNFDMVAMAWSGVVEYDPKQIWHSESSRKGGSNFIGYRNPEVDKVIELARKTMDRKKRIELMNRFSELVAADAPYIFLFSERYDKYAHNERVEKIKDTFKFTTGFDFMWIK